MVKGHDGFMAKKKCFEDIKRATNFSDFFSKCAYHSWVNVSKQKVVSVCESSQTPHNVGKRNSLTLFHSYEKKLKLYLPAERKMKEFP